MVQSRDARGAVGEISILVVGILLAFGVDAAWQGFENARLAREVASALIESFEANRGQLRVRMERRERKMAATEALLEMASGDAQAAPPDSVSTLLNQLVRIQDFDPDDSRLRELVTSGRMHLVRDEGLRILLASWDGRVTNLRGLEDQALDLTTLSIRPWLRTRVPWRVLAGSSVALRPLSQEHVALLDALEFENLLREMSLSDVRAQGSAEEVMLLIDEILLLLSDAAS